MLTCCYFLILEVEAHDRYNLFCTTHLKCQVYKNHDNLNQPHDLKTLTKLSSKNISYMLTTWSSWDKEYCEFLLTYIGSQKINIPENHGIS